MDYFFTPPGQIQADRLTISDREFTHLVHVMRGSPGDEIMVVDGAGNEFRARIDDVVQHEARCSILSHFHRRNEPSCRLVLAVGLLKNSARFDFIVEKSTELGVSMIIPLRTKRTIPERGRNDRWQKIALSAMKQSCRSVLPNVSVVTPFEEFLEQAGRDAEKFIAHEKAPAGSAEFGTKDSAEVVLCIGPEGGFDEDEVEHARANGFKLLRFGGRRLRTETAAITGAALLLAGDNT